MKRFLLMLAVAAVAFVVGLQVGRSGDGRPDPVFGEEVETRLMTILDMPEPIVRARALSDFFAQLNPASVDTVQAIFDARRRDVDEVAEVLFAAWWSRFDPGSALDGRIPPNWGGDDPWTRTVIREWVRLDPESALVAVTLLPKAPEPAKLEAIRSVIRGWFDHADTDPGALTVLFEQINQVRVRGEMINNWAKRMLETRGAEYSIRFAESMPEGETMRLKREMMGRLAAQIAMTDPVVAVDFVERNGDSPAGSKMRVYMVNRWAYGDGPAAMAWSLGLQADERERVVSRAWRSFQIGDREAALEWMAEQSHSPALEPAYALYLMSPVAQEDHQMALRLSAQIEDPKRRMQVWQAVGRSWIEDDPGAVEAWMVQVGMPADIKQRVRAKAPISLDERGRIEPQS